MKFLIKTTLDYSFPAELKILIFFVFYPLAIFFKKTAIVEILKIFKK